MKNLLFTLFLLLGGGILLYFLVNPTIQYGGDIVEYYGITESLVNHQTIALSRQDKQNLIERLGPGYFDNPEYYIEGKNGKNYPVHFPLYSLLLTPIRLLLSFIGLDTYTVFRVFNLVVLFGFTLYIVKRYAKDATEAVLLSVLITASPLLWYMVWPGPEVYSVMLMLVSLFLFSEGTAGKRLTAIAVASIASYQSQPLVLLPLGYLLIILFEKYWPAIKRTTLKKRGAHLILGLPVPEAADVLLTLFLAGIIALPNIFYSLLFGTFSSYARLEGVGFGNASLQKLVELYFDPNIGLFFYAPIIMIAGLISWFVLTRKNKEYIWLGLILLGISVLYLTNTNWNSGTAGYGPTRYSLYALSFLVFFIFRAIQTVSNKRVLTTVISILALATHSVIFAFNGYLSPDFSNTVRHSPMARFVLNNIPALYNPTPEIFVERTIGKEGGFWDTTIYKDRNGACKKAYTLITSTQKLVDECGFIPPGYEEKLKNEFVERASFPRTVLTTEATFYPADDVCAWDYQPSKERPYVCMKTIEDVAMYAGITDPGRVEAVENAPGVWKLKWGKAIAITVPPGYIINHYSFTGVYVNY